MAGLLLLLLLLFHCSALCGAHVNETTPTFQFNGTSDANNLTLTSPLPGIPSAAPAPERSTTASIATTSATASIATTSATAAAPNWMSYRKECLSLYLVSGGLIIACTVLLVTSLVLAWKVRHLSRRLKALSGDADLISNCEYWMGTARKDKSRRELEAKETSVLMADLSRTQEAVGDGADKEEGGKVNGDAQMGGDKKVDDGGEEGTEAAPVTEKTSSSQPQGETTDPPSEEPKGDE